MNTPTEFMDTVGRTMIDFLQILPLLLLAAFPVVLMGFFIFEMLSGGNSKTRRRRANRFRVENAIIAYKAADLTTHGFKGVSGGGHYGHLEEGKLDPGFHALKSVEDLRGSIYGIYADVYLEVLLYGEVVEYQNGYIGSHQRVLQVIIPSNSSLRCYRCYRGQPEYFDKKRSSIPPSEMEGPLICENCKRGSRMLSWTLGKASFKLYRDDPERFVPLGDYFEARNERSGNPQPIGFAGSLEELMPTVLPNAVSAR